MTEQFDRYIAAFDAAIRRIMAERGLTDPGELTEADVERARKDAN